MDNKDFHFLKKLNTKPIEKDQKKVLNEEKKKSLNDSCSKGDNIQNSKKQENNDTSIVPPSKVKILHKINEEKKSIPLKDIQSFTIQPIPSSEEIKTAKLPSNQILHVAKDQKITKNIVAFDIKTLPNETPNTQLNQTLLDLKNNLQSLFDWGQ